MKKIVCLILACSLLFSAACTQNNADNDENVFLLSNFEQYSPDFEQIVILNDFGAINVNKDAQFVKSGETSAKLNPLGDYYNATSPVMVVPLKSVRFGYDYTDLTKIEKIRFSLYSEEAGATVRFGYTFDALYSVRTSPQAVRLNSGWNNLSFTVETDLLNLVYDVTDCTGFYLQFENVGYQASKDIADAPTYYLDEIILELYEENQVISDDIIVLEEDEFCSFDKLYQGYVFKTGSYTEATLPIASVVETENGVEPTSGRKMLKVEYPAATIENESWPSFSFTKKISAKIDWEKYIEEPESWEFCFDVYSVSEVETAFLPGFTYGDGDQWGIDKQEFSVFPSRGNWVTCRISMATLYNTNHNALSENVEVIINVLSSLNERLCYFDSFRFEKI